MLSATDMLNLPLVVRLRRIDRKTDRILFMLLAPLNEGRLQQSATKAKGQMHPLGRSAAEKGKALASDRAAVNWLQ